MEEYLVALAHYPKITYNRYRKLAGFFGNPSEIWLADLARLIKAGWEAEAADDFLEWRESNPVALLLSNLENEGITAITINDELYPRWLSQIADPPLTIFARGIIPAADRPCLAVVGTRRCTAYGQVMTERIAGELAAQGVCIVSGLALGIDGAAHAAALKNNGVTMAVLGSGIDSQAVYPRSHQRLSEQIIKQGGALLSEYPPGFKPTQYSFPARNRIIAGLTQGTLVIEAPAQSGALITARLALDYNREVMAVPHPATSLSGAGGNNLIKTGATLVTSAADVADALNLRIIADQQNRPLPLNLDADELKIITILTECPKHIDEIISASGLPSGVVGTKLTLLELNGKIKNMGNTVYLKNT